MKTVITAFFILLSFLFTPIAAFADTYGSGSYGNGAYGAQSSSNTNAVSSAVTSVDNAISAFFCSNQAPTSAPNLYEIDVTSTTATLYFAPAGGPDDNYYIAYGQGNDSEGNGVQFSTSQSSGALFFKIEQLSRGTVYTFKVRGGNGCKPGSWSNTLTVQTLSSGSRAIKKYYPTQQAQYTQAPSASWLTQAGNYISSLLPGAPNTGFAPVKLHTKVSQQTSQGTSSKQKQNNSSHSMWGSITNFFSGIFHAL